MDSVVTRVGQSIVSRNIGPADPLVDMHGARPAERVGATSISVARPAPTSVEGSLLITFPYSWWFRRHATGVRSIVQSGARQDHESVIRMMEAASARGSARGVTSSAANRCWLSTSAAWVDLDLQRSDLQGKDHPPGAPERIAPADEPDRAARRLATTMS